MQNRLPLFFCVLLIGGLLLAGAAPASADTTGIAYTAVSSDSSQLVRGQSFYATFTVIAGETNLFFESSDSFVFILYDAFGNRFDTYLAVAADTTFPNRIETGPAYPLQIANFSFLLTLSATLDTGAYWLDGYCTGTIYSDTPANPDSPDSYSVGDTSFYWDILPDSKFATDADSFVVTDPAGGITFLSMKLYTWGDTTTVRDTVTVRRLDLADSLMLEVAFQNTGASRAQVTFDSSQLTITNKYGVNVVGGCTLLAAPGNPKYLGDSLTANTMDTWYFFIVFPDSNAWRNNPTWNMLGELKVGVTGTGSTAFDTISGTILTITRLADTQTVTGYYEVATTLGDTVYSPDTALLPVSLTIPAGFFPPGTAVTINPIPTDASLAAAEAELASNVLLEGVDSTTFQVLGTNAALAGEAILAIGYNEVGMKAAEEASIRMYKVVGNSWISVSSIAGVGATGTDATANICRANLPSLSFYRLIITAPVANDLSRVRVYPNPFIPYDDNTDNGAVYTGAAGTGVTFIGLTDNCEISIFTLDGTLLDRVNVLDAGGYQWDAKNDHGDECASGIYFYLVTDAGGGMAKGTLCIIR